jgi:hypothetical protein
MFDFGYDSGLDEVEVAELGGLQADAPGWLLADAWEASDGGNIHSYLLELREAVEFWREGTSERDEEAAYEAHVAAEWAKSERAELALLAEHPGWVI